MNIKKCLLILIIILGLAGCVKVKDLSYDDIINTMTSNPKKANTYKKGYQLYVPKGIHTKMSGPNYMILGSNDINYYVYVDLVSYIERKDITYNVNNSLYYSRNITYGDNKGYAEIKLKENNKYLIEIMYNYAKIEVMVDEANVNKALINSINILKSIKYNDDVIEKLLADDKLTYTEEIFDMFESIKDKENSNNTSEDNNDSQEEIKDTDFLN